MQVIKQHQAIRLGSPNVSELLTSCCSTKHLLIESLLRVVLLDGAIFYVVPFGFSQGWRFVLFPLFRFIATATAILSRVTGSGFCFMQKRSGISATSARSCKPTEAPGASSGMNMWLEARNSRIAYSVVEQMKNQTPSSSMFYYIAVQQPVPGQCALAQPVQYTTQSPK